MDARGIHRIPLPVLLFSNAIHVYRRVVYFDAVRPRYENWYVLALGAFAWIDLDRERIHFAPTAHGGLLGGAGQHGFFAA